MPLPQQVINQLSQDSSSTPGWSAGILIFGCAIFASMLVIYFSITLVFEPRLNGQVSDLQNQVATLGQSISTGDQAKLITFYSQISNLQTLLQNHILFSQFFTWLESNTEANVYYSSFTFSNGGQVTITGNAPSEADINEQIAAFEGSPELQKVVVSNVDTQGTAGSFQFTATLIINPSLITASS